MKWKKRMIRFLCRSTKNILLLPVLFAVLLCSCVSHLKDAKFYYAQAQGFSRVYQTEKAVASFKKSLEEAEKEVVKKPSAQAFMVKGLTELHLSLWEEAEQSFLAAFSYGFDDGQEWAAGVSLFGLASSMEEMGLEDSAFQIYAYLVDKSKLKLVTIFAAQKYTELVLQKALEEEGKQREKQLSGLLREIESLTKKDLSCGFFHYLQSQVLGHMVKYRRSFEEAVMAKELGLPTQEIMRDNDLQIVSCFQRLREELSQGESEKFHALYLEWVKRWDWPDPEIPDWKKR
jgi:tetratricopeptide (TPR) repeat protein